MRLNHRVAAMLAGALLVVAACHDAPTRPRLQSPLVGQWELTTQLDTFSFETGAPSPPDCPGFTMYCTHYRTTTAGAYLGGLIEVQDSTNSADTITKTVFVAGSVQVSFCDSIDYQGLTGCAHVSDRTAAAYVGLITGPPDSSLSNGLNVAIGEPADAFGFHVTMRSYDATYAGDSIYGKIYWGQSAGRSPPTYRGTFVMRRVH